MARWMAAFLPEFFPAFGFAFQFVEATSFQRIEYSNRTWISPLLFRFGTRFLRIVARGYAEWHDIATLEDNK